MAQPVKVFILAGDENCLEQAPVASWADVSEALFFPEATPSKDEMARHVHYAVYTNAAGKIPAVATGLVGIGQGQPKKGVKLTPFPAVASQDGHTTVLRGYLTVPRSGRYEIVPPGFNVTTVAGQEVYRWEAGQVAPKIAGVELEGKKRIVFETTFFAKPGADFRISQVNIPGTLDMVAKEKKTFAASRDDVLLYDAHPIHNNTRAPGRPLAVGGSIGPELMLGNVLGDHFKEPVFLLRFATRHPIWFLRGSRSLGHDYLPPSSGGDPDLAGNWDVIHFNFGVWDATYREASSKYFSGHHTTSVADFEKNLRTLVAKMKKTGATIIWGTVTPVWKGDDPNKPNADVDAFNAVAEKVMKENGVIINDLNAEVRRQGLPKTTNVHDVGNLAPKVTKTILAALDARENKTKPLPRVLMIGDSITGSYLEQVTKNLDGKAAVFKNPGNAEDTWNGLEQIDRWLDLKTYLQSGQEYLELVNAVNDSLAQLPRFLPGYANQGYAIAGLVWFQGIADSQSPARAAVYEQNLANLIRDLRRDWKAPQLPVVVAAVPFKEGNIRDAQLAIGDPAKYPEFAGNVKVVDTQPLMRGGDPRTLGNHAETILEAGTALGKALIELEER